MAMFAPIPLPGNGNDVFKDVMDYFEEIQKRKSLQNIEGNKLAQQKYEFGKNYALDQQKLSELANYHSRELEQNLSFNELRKDKLRAEIYKLQHPDAAKSLSPQERSEAMKLLEAGRSLKSITDKAHGINSLLEEDHSLTGWRPGIEGAMGLGSERLGQFIEKSGELQTALARLASQRGGAQVIKFAGRIKPNQWKDYSHNKGMTKSILDNSYNDFDEIKNEYKDLTGKEFPISLLEYEKEKNNDNSSSDNYVKKVKVKDNITGQIKEMTLEEANKLISGGV